MSDNIKVVVKVRPLIPRESEDGMSYQWRVKNNVALYQLDQNGRELGVCFTFDKVYDKDTRTSDIYNDIAKPIVEAATAGFNGTIFAYGQTSSGKTYTMSGTEESPGIIPLAVKDLFQIIKNIPDRDFLVRVSYIEIYNETLIDLLNLEKKNIKIKENFQGVKVDCTEIVTTSPEEVLKYLKQGEANRQTGPTRMNEESSRSHSIFQITIESRDHIEGEESVGCVNVSTLNLVDLAGSERAGQTGATGIRFKEGTHINKSLSALALVIKQLSEDQTKHVNYRDSRLTRILQNSLGGNAKTSIICAVTPAAVDETISTLQFASRAKAIKNTPEVNAVATNATMIQELTKQLSKLQSQLESKKNLEVMLESKKHVEQDLQKQIAALQRLILNGFGQRSSIDASGTRRKPVQPRRVTISTLHSIDEESVSILPKFHTPLLKYNPMSIPDTDFVPIQNNKLCCVSEEKEWRLVTPPPQEKKDLNDEIIDLDSDDANISSEIQICSPYHKCRVTSETPPCVLRKNAKLAEKNYNDIVELTEREKIYTPEVIELIKKLEETSSIKTQLQEEVISLDKTCKEKDLQIEQLKLKVTKSMEEIQSVNSAKSKLEKLCEDYTVKLTDWEVSYENLQRKTKKREEELLSLLEEHNPPNKCDRFNKPIMPIQERELNFMDMSKDISLVNSDNECSILNANDGESANHFQELMSELQNQLTLKSNTILKIEEELVAGNQKIQTLESSCLSLQNVIDQLNNKMSMLENENDLLKSTMDTLNNTVQSQKANLESAHVDMESYNILIRELQIKLANKEKILNININEDFLENMIANEEKILANNDNMKNIITSFKLVINNKNKELESLKLINSTNLIDNNDLKDQLIKKEEEISKLNDRIKSLQIQINENIVTISKLMEDKKNLTDAEQRLSSELRNMSDNNKIIENTIEQNKIKFEEKYLEQFNIMAEKTEIERNLLVANETLNRDLSNLTEKVLKLEKEICTKDDEILSLTNSDNDLKDLFANAKLTIQKLFNIITNLLGDLPDHYKNDLDIQNIPNDMLLYLETKLKDIVSQIDIESKNNIILKKELELFNDNHCKEMQLQMELLTKTQQEHQRITNERDKINNKFELQNTELNGIKTDLIVSKEHNEKLESDLLIQENMILDLKEKESSLLAQIQTMELDVAKGDGNGIQLTDEMKIELDSKITLLSEKDKIIDELRENLKKLDSDLDEKVTEICILNNKIKQIIDEYNSQLNSICQEVSKTFDLLNINTNEDSSAGMYKIICKMSNQVTDSVASLKYEKSEEISKMSEILSNAKKEISQLTIHNQCLLDRLGAFEQGNSKLVSELEEIKVENRSINKDLVIANKNIQVIKNALKEKSLELENMVTKTQVLNEHFTEWNTDVKDQSDQLKSENEILKNKLRNLGKDENRQSFTYSDTMSNYMQTIQCSDVNTNKHAIKSPSSLVTICCKHIIKAIQPSEKSVSTTNSNISFDHYNNSDYDEVVFELNSAQSEILRLTNVIEELQSRNQELITEHEEVRKEVELLLEPAYELQMKINNHKTNLSILTATTYAENRSLNSHVKGLQHYHRKFHNACQKDIPLLKKQLFELQTILKNDNLSIDKHNSSFKRFSLPCILDSNSSVNALKNDSTLDGDLLMLDTNLTSTTLDDTTMIGVDQTCLEVTQVCLNIDVACQTNEDLNSDSLSVNPEIMLLSANELKEMHQQINNLEHQNKELKEQIDKFLTDNEPVQNDDFINKIKIMSQELIDVKRSKEEIESKYNNLMLEVPSTDALVSKLNLIEKDYNNKLQDISKLTNILSEKNLQLKQLQQENDSLSTQVMENITETDDLNKALDDLKESNARLSEKCLKLEKMLEETSVWKENHTTLNRSQCLMKDKTMQIQQNVDLHSKLNRSLSDSDTSSRYNKICTLQNELHAGREDCKELTEDVVTIRNHLDRGNMCIEQNMELDESITDTNILTFNKNLDPNTQLNKLNISNIQNDQHLDLYTLEKNDCLSYYIEQTETNKENLACDIKIIDLMKMFYNDIVAKHSNQIENLVNKIKCYEESRTTLETHFNDISKEVSHLKISLAEKENHIITVTDLFLQLRRTMAIISDEIKSGTYTHNNNTKLVTTFTEKVLKILDDNFNLNSTTIFDNIINAVETKHQNELKALIDQNTKLQEHVESITSELNTVHENLLQMKYQLSSKENEYNLLKAQKERVHEISNAVTLDIIRKEQDLHETLIEGCKKLMENNIMCSDDINICLPLNKRMQILFERIISDCGPKVFEAEKQNLLLEIKKSQSDVEENKKALETLTTENQKLTDINNTLTRNLQRVEDKLQLQINSQNDLQKAYDVKIEENKAFLLNINEISEELMKLKEELNKKERVISELKGNNKQLNDNTAKITELLNIIDNYKEEICNMKSIHDIIIKEKEIHATELEECKKTIEANKTLLDKMTFDIITLNESVKESSTTIDELKTELSNQLQENTQLKGQIEEKNRYCARLEMNIKTHEKTAEIQSKMIIRLQKQKEEDDKTISNNNSKIEKLAQDNSGLQTEVEVMKTNVNNLREEIEIYKSTKESLEVRISELESDLSATHNPRTSTGATADSTRRRRQSVHDSRRALLENSGDDSKIEAIFDARPKPQDLFMDVDEVSSNRSTPVRSSRGRDSLLSRHDQSEPEEEQSRPDRVAALRRRRQSAHDRRRAGVHTAAPHPQERPGSRQSDSSPRQSLDVDNSIQSELKQLRETLTKCQQEMEELKKQNMELDEECETCSQYLREREAQCLRLKKEKVALENTVADLKNKFQSLNPNRSQQEPKPTFADASANTDEDWTNLHSVVVDRMSFDAEVEKNKRLTKTVEELRFKKQELKNTLGKMQKALERHASKDYNREMEASKSELKACKQELKDLKEKFSDLGNKYDSCAQYLREREEQYRKLKETRNALEAKLQEYQEDSNKISHSLRKKRQSIYDQNRCPEVDVTDASTEICEYFLNCQVERDNTKQTNETRRLNLVIEKLTQQKEALKQKLVSTSATPNPMYIATGSAIVQNQQITDVLKENQKLKKVNAKLVQICKKRGKQSDIENRDISEQA